MARRSLQPLDITLRHGRRYQLVRRSFLGLWVVVTFLLPLWHLHTIDVEGSGRGGGTFWSTVASWLPSLPLPFFGSPTSFSFFGLEFVDPALALGVALVHGVNRTWWWAVLPGLLLVVPLGRYFCGWACPYLPILAASNAARWFLSGLGVPLKDVQVPRMSARVILVGVLLATVLTGTQVLPLLYPPAIIGREVFRGLFYGSLGLGAVVVLLAFLFDTFVSRAGFCRSLCPGGAMFSLVGSLSPIRVKNERSKCTDCTVCDVVCNLGQSPMTNRLDEGCERCGKCIASCPTKALSWSLEKPPLLRALQGKKDDRP